MKIETIPFAAAARPEDIAGKAVVVFDIFRATSVMVNALHNGAKEILPCLAIDEAFAKAESFEKGAVLLGGEREAEKIAGFHLGNSPQDYSKTVVSGKSVILTTSNGTRALRACTGAKEVLIGSFLNLETVANHLQKSEQIVLLCSGTLGKFSIEDGMAAATIIELLAATNQPKMDDLSQNLLITFQAKKANLNELLKNGRHGKYLINKGYAKDVDFCLQKNRFATLPFYAQKERAVFN